MSEDFHKWLKDVSGDDAWVARIHHNWSEGPATLRIAADELASIASDDGALEYIEEEGWKGILEYKDLDQPYNGWSGYDEEGAKETFLNEFDDDLLKEFEKDAA